MSMIDRLPKLGEHGSRLRTLRDLPRELANMAAGRLTLAQVLDGQRIGRNPVEVIVHDGEMLRKLGYHEALRQAGFREGDNINEPRFRHILKNARFDPAIKSVSRSHNLRVTMGRDQVQRLQMFGDITANSSGFTHVAGTASTGPTSTTLTNSSAAFPTSGGVNGSLQGHAVFVPGTGNGVYGIILSNTATVLTVDQWTDATSATGAVGTTPSNGAAYIVTPGALPVYWIGLSTNSAASQATDVLRTADGLFGDGTTSASATEQSTNGLSRAFVQPTLISGGVQWDYTWTYLGSSTVTLAKGVLCNSKAGAGSLLLLETLMSSTATLNASGDTLTIQWQCTL